MTKRFLLAVNFVLTAFLNVYCVSSIAGPLDDKRGVWYNGGGSCDHPTVLLYAEPPIYLSINENYALPSKAPSAGYEKGQYYLEIYPNDNRTYNVSYSWVENGMLLIQQNTLQNDRSPTSEPIINSPSRAFLRCEHMSSSLSFLHGEGITFMAHASSISAACQQDGTQCAQAVMELIDVSKDGKLSKAELTRAIRILAYFAPLLAKQDTWVSIGEISGYVASASLLGPLLASSIIGGSDYNNDGQISLDEIFIDRDMSGLNAVARQVPMDLLVKLVGSMFSGLSLFSGFVR